jgi:hypothetical protein
LDIRKKETMATKKHTVVGTAMWSKVFEHNGELKDYQGNPHPFGKKFKIDVILDKENKALYKASGSAGKGKFDDDGNFIATFSRKEKDRFEWASGVPEVLNADGTKFDATLIPNGSKVEVEFSVYTTSMTPGTRLEKVIVLDLAEMPPREEVPKVEATSTVTKAGLVNVEVPF